MSNAEHNAEAMQPLPSATVVLVRDGRSAPEVFLVHRPAGAAFGASYVFPGGLLEPADGKVGGRSGLTAQTADRCLAVKHGGLDYYSAAIRELFEETGVVLARNGATGEYPDDAAALRRQLNAGAVSWDDFLEQQNLLLECESLHYFAYWITPRARPRRFSTRFFLASMPQGQSASHDGEELTDSRWATAADAIAANDSGDIALPPPTLATLRDLREFGRVEELLAWARRRSETGVVRILPAILSSDGRDRVVMPGHPDYPAHADRGEQ
jgi:8-oxo-dGTP pyrophosphatase MutT (NUDIX family)